MQESGEFERHRPRLFGIAYRMLGSRTDAEDLLQDAYLRWHRGASAELRSPEAWLVTTVTRLCIDRLRAARTEREHYVGPWLPEPLIGDTAPPADARAELSSSLSIAFLVVLEQLEPDERAAFLLHEVFDTAYAEIAEILGKSEAACPLAAWRETPFFDDRERAALEWTEAVTRVAETHVPDDAYERVKQHFSEQELIDLTLAITQINTWNRLNVAFRMLAGNYRPGMYKEWMAAAAGSAA